MNWSQAKKKIQSLESAEQLKLLKMLFALSAENKTVFERLLEPRGTVSLDHYKKEIASSVNPGWNAPVNLARGRKAISQFKKIAPDDIHSRLDLMMHFVEQAAAQTLKFGTVNERFYDSMYKMLNSILDLSKQLHPAKYQDITIRFQSLDSKTSGKIGWGVCDHISECREELKERASKIGLLQNGAG